MVDTILGSQRLSRVCQDDGVNDITKTTTKLFLDGLKEVGIEKFRQPYLENQYAGEVLAEYVLKDGTQVDVQNVGTIIARFYSPDDEKPAPSIGYIGFPVEVSIHCQPRNAGYSLRATDFRKGQVAPIFNWVQTNWVKSSDDRVTGLQALADAVWISRDKSGTQELGVGIARKCGDKLCGSFVKGSTKEEFVQNVISNYTLPLECRAPEPSDH